MNKNHATGSVKEMKGKVKEEVGHWTGDTKTSVKGVAEQIAGKIERGFGDLKDAVKEKVDHLLHSSEKR